MAERIFLKEQVKKREQLNSEKQREDPERVRTERVKISFLDRLRGRRDKH